MKMKNEGAKIHFYSFDARNFEPCLFQYMIIFSIATYTGSKNAAAER